MAICTRSEHNHFYIHLQVSPTKNTQKRRELTWAICAESPGFREREDLKRRKR